MSCLFLTAPLAEAKIIEVEALGIGDDYDWAVANAIENAVKQTSEVSIERNAPMAKAVAKVKASESVEIDEGGLRGKKSAKANAEAEASAEIQTIDIKYKGKVKSYNVISTQEKGDQVEVKIKAKIFVADDYVSPGLGKKGKYTLSIVPFKGPNNFPCMGKRISTQDIVKQLNNGLVAEIQASKKFNLLDRQNFDAYATEALLIEGDLTKESNKSRLKNISSADYLLVGSIDGFATSAEETYIEMTRELYVDSAASMQVSYRLIETATMEIIASGVIDKSLAKEGSFSSCANVAKALGKKVSQQISEDMLTELFPDYQPKSKKKPKGRKASGPSNYQPAPPPVIKLPFDE